MILFDLILSYLILSCLVLSRVCVSFMVVTRLCYQKAGGNYSFDTAFDTVDHAVLFNLLEHSLGISGTALSLLKSYLQGRSQCVQIDGITAEFADLTCGVPQGSVLGPLNFCMYMYPLDSILRHHCINYHINADDTQLYISFDSSDPSIAIDKVNKCISDIRTWMIQNKLKINDSKTEFLVLTSSF